MEPDSEPTQTPRARFNSILRSVVQHLLDTAPKASFFLRAVSRAVVHDYRDFVSAADEVYLDLIIERANAQQYDSVSAFRADLARLHENAVAYHGPTGGGKHAYEPVMHWAAELLAVAAEHVERRMPELLAAEQELQVHEVAPAEAAAMDTHAPAAPAAQPPLPPAHAIQPLQGGEQPGPLSPQPQPQQQLPQPPPQQPQQQRAKDLSAGGGSHRADGAGSTGQQSSSPSSNSGGGSGGAAPSGLDALLAACELAAEQDVRPPVRPYGSSNGAVSSGAATGAGAACTSAGAAPPARVSFPGSTSALPLGAPPPPQRQSSSQVAEAPVPPPAAPPHGLGGQHSLVLFDVQAAMAQQQAALHLALGQGQGQPEAPAGSSEDGMASWHGRGSEGSDQRALVVRASGGAGAATATSSYLTSNAFKNRRHKSKVFIKPNKVVYLPTTFVEEEFDVAMLPLDCELLVEADGALARETFRVTIKAVPRQGLSTMYCMTNVMRFQQQYLNWQIFNWTRMPESHIKIHLQSPAGAHRHELDRSASMPEVGRPHAASRRSEDGGAAASRSAGGNSLKRKSETGRLQNPRAERKHAVEPGSELALDLRVSSNCFFQLPPPILESPPASPQRRPSGGLPHLPPRPPAGAALPQQQQQRPPLHLYHHSLQPALQSLQALQSAPMQPLRAASFRGVPPKQEFSGGGELEAGAAYDTGSMPASASALLQQLASQPQPRQCLSASGVPVVAPMARGGLYHVPQQHQQHQQQLHQLHQQHQLSQHQPQQEQLLQAKLAELTQQLQLQAAGAQGEPSSHNLVALQFALAAAAAQQQQEQQQQQAALLMGGLSGYDLLAGADGRHPQLRQGGQQQQRQPSLPYQQQTRSSGDAQAEELQRGGGAGAGAGFAPGSRGGSSDGGRWRDAADYPPQPQRRQVYAQRQDAGAQRQPERRPAGQADSDTEGEECAEEEQQPPSRPLAGLPPHSRLALGADGGGGGGPVGRRSNTGSAVDAGRNLNACSTAELLSMLSPGERFKIAVSAAQQAEAAGGAAAMGALGGLLGGWAAGHDPLGLTAGGMGVPEATLAAMRSAGLLGLAQPQQQQQALQGPPYGGRAGVLAQLM